MKKIFLALILLPLIVFAGQSSESSTLSIFKSGCANDKDAELNQRNCDLAKQVEKADALVKNFNKNSSVRD